MTALFYQLLFDLFQNSQRRNESCFLIFKHQSMIRVVAPHVQLRCLLFRCKCYGTRVWVSSCNESYFQVIFFEIIDLLRIQRIFTVIMTQLTFFPITPAEDAAIFTEAKCMLPSTCNLNNRFLVDNASDHCRHVDVVRTSMTELPEHTPAPGIDLAFVTNCSGVMITAIKGWKRHLASFSTHHLDVCRDLESILWVIAASAIFAGAPHKQLAWLKLIRVVWDSRQKCCSFILLKVFMVFNVFCD